MTNFSLSVVHYLSSAKNEHTKRAVQIRSNMQAFIRSVPFKTVHRTPKWTTGKSLLSNGLNAFERTRFAVHLPFNAPGQRTADNGHDVNASEHVRSSVHLVFACRSVLRSRDLLRHAEGRETFPDFVS